MVPLLLVRILSAHLWSGPQHLASFINDFARLMTMWKKAHITKGYQNPKRKLGVTVQVFFLGGDDYLVISAKMRVNQHFSF